MLASCGLWFEALFQEQTLVIGGIVEPGKFVVTEPPIEIRRLERKGVEPGGMAAEIATVALGLGQQAASVSGPRPCRTCLGRVNFAARHTASETFSPPARPPSIGAMDDVAVIAAVTGRWCCGCRASAHTQQKTWVYCGRLRPTHTPRHKMADGEAFYQ
jgi:hypothetical protein